MADCSLSVYRLDSLQGLPAAHIESYLWLSSDLKGKIESPDYYFDHPEDEEAMDNLMISHGWRRFRWEEVLRQTRPSFEFPPEYNGAIIQGKVVEARTGAAPTIAVGDPRVQTDPVLHPRATRHEAGRGGHQAAIAVVPPRRIPPEAGVSEPESFRDVQGAHSGCV